MTAIKAPGFAPLQKPSTADANVADSKRGSHESDLIADAPSPSRSTTAANLTQVQTELKLGGRRPALPASIGAATTLEQKLRQLLPSRFDPPPDVRGYLKLLPSLPTETRRAILTAIHQSGFVSDLFEKQPAEALSLFSELTSDRERLLIALGCRAPVQFFNLQTLRKLLPTHEDLRLAIKAHPNLFIHLSPEEKEQSSFQYAFVKYADYTELRQQLMHLRPRDKETVLTVLERIRHEGGNESFPGQGIGHMFSAATIAMADLDTNIRQDPRIIRAFMALVPDFIRIADYAPQLTESEQGWKSLPAGFSRNRALLLEAVAVNRQAFFLADPALKTDPTFQLQCLRRNILLTFNKDFRAQMNAELLQNRELLLELAKAESQVEIQKRIDSVGAYFDLEFTPVASLIPKPYLQDVDFIRQMAAAGMAIKKLPAALIDKDLARIAVSVKAENLLDVPRPLWTKKLVINAVNHERNEFVLEDIAIALKAQANLKLKGNLNWQREIAMANGLMVKHLDPSLQRNPTFALEVVARCGEALGGFANTIRANPKIVKVAVKSSPRAIRSTKLNLEKHLDIVFAAIDRMPLVYGVLPKSLRLRRDVALQAAPAFISHAAASEMKLPEQLSDDAVFMTTLMHKQAGAFFHASPRLLRDPQFVAAAIHIFPPLLTRLPPSAVPQELMEHLYPDLVAPSQDLESLLSRLKIRHPFNFRVLGALYEAIANRLSPQRTNNKPLAVTIYSPKDKNGALEYSQLPELMQGHFVMYYEEELDDGLINSILEATQTQVGEFLFVAGHGNRTSTSLGDEDPALIGQSREEAAALDLSDRAQLLKAELGRRFSPNAVAVIASCLTGLGREHIDNVGNLVAQAILPGRPVYAPVLSTNLTLQFDANHRFRAPGYWEGEWIAHIARFSSTPEQKQEPLVKRWRAEAAKKSATTADPQD